MKYNEDAFRALVQRSFQGDSAAYREVLRRLTELLRTYIRRQLRQVGRADHDAEDIVQEALIAIHTRWHTYDPGMPLTAWAHAIARFKLIDFLRATTNRSRDLSMDDVETSTTDGHAIDAAIALSNLIAMLPERLRRSFELVRIRGVSVKDAAAMTGLSEASVKVNVHRAAKIIEEQFWN